MFRRAFLALGSFSPTSCASQCGNTVRTNTGVWRQNGTPLGRFSAIWLHRLGSESCLARTDVKRQTMAFVLKFC